MSITGIIGTALVAVSILLLSCSIPAIPPAPATTTSSPTIVISSSSITSAPSTITPTMGAGTIDPRTGQYENYYLGLVKDPLVEAGNGSYDSRGDLIVLINNRNANNPTYSELVNFLESDNTDEYAYLPSGLTTGSYYGAPEDLVDLGHIKAIIDGSAQPGPPSVCADFAERLHNEAEMAGLRCGYVTIINLDHAIDVFETTDRGVIFIDDTGKSNDVNSPIVTPAGSISFGASTSWDKVAYVAVGKPYGLIDLKSASYFGLDYSAYDNWLAAKQTLDALQTQYDNLAGGRTVVPQATYDQLQIILAQEKVLIDQLGGFWDSLGNVTGYDVTWDGSWRSRN